MDTDELVKAAAAWMADDPDPATRAEIQALLDADDAAGLAERFAERLQFGTAGLRGKLGAGPNRMNRALIRRAAAGLARWLHAVHTDRAGVVIGFDARHQSREFALDTAAVVAGAGLHAYVLPRPLPTPLLAYATRHLNADAGVMVTASHNPAQYNGYKVYLGDGAQVFPPHDALIAAAAEESAVPTDQELSRGTGGRLLDVDDKALLAAYRCAVLKAVRPDGPRRLRAVYTPVHGVGGAVLPRLFEEAGFDPPALVASQAQPDPDFPTAPFPNPEEPGVLDLALAEGERVGADLVLANDPDADRLAIAVPCPTVTGPPGGTFRALSGDELGVLLADHLISATTGADRLVATTVV
ncbi:MAG: phospho-sugar mutase, partial [Acidimicrobiales bacterium]